MSRTIKLIALALAAAAVAAPLANAVTDPNGQQAVDPLAASYLRGQGLSPSQVKARTVGIDPLAASYLRNNGFPQVQASPQIVTVSTGFDWADAGVGAGATLGAVLLLAGLGAALVAMRHNRGRHVASA